MLVPTLILIWIAAAAAAVWSTRTAKPQLARVPVKKGSVGRSDSVAH